MKLDVYDFDDTIYDGDSTANFYLYCLKNKPSLVRYLPIQIWYFIKYKLKLVSKENFKEKFYIFFNGINNIDEYVKKFWNKNENKLRYELIKKTENQKYIISASPEFLLQEICSRKLKNFKLIASKVNKNTGKLESKNCYGEEKVQRLKQEIKEDFKIENFFSDSMSDGFLAELSENSYLVKKKGKTEEWNKK